MSFTWSFVIVIWTAAGKPSYQAPELHLKRLGARWKMGQLDVLAGQVEKDSCYPVSTEDPDSEVMSHQHGIVHLKKV